MDGDTTPATDHAIHVDVQVEQGRRAVWPPQDTERVDMSNTTMQSFGTSARIGHDSSSFYNRKLYDGSEVAEDDPSPENMVPELNRLYAHSSTSMHELPDNSVHLMVSSPPYNVGKDYDEDMTEAEYRDLLRAVWQETYRVLVHGGRACINVANLGRRPYVPLSAFITQDMMDAGFLMRGQIIWNKQASAGSSCAWGSWRSPSNPVLRDVHEYILVFCKGDFARKKPDGDQKLPTIGKEDFLEWTKSVWQFPAESAKRVKHPAPFPVELPARCIQLYTYSNDVVLDPFMGSGTTAVAAQEAGRSWVGYDISPEYVALGYERLDSRVAAK